MATRRSRGNGRRSRGRGRGSGGSSRPEYEYTRVGSAWLNVREDGDPLTAYVEDLLMELVEIAEQDGGGANIRITSRQDEDGNDVPITIDADTEIFLFPNSYKNPEAEDYNPNEPDFHLVLRQET